MKTSMKRAVLALTIAASIFGGTVMAHAQSAYLEISLKIDAADRPAAAEIYAKYKQPFLTTIVGATSKQLLVRDDDVQVLHGFKSMTDAEAYLKSDLFTHDVVTALKPLLKAQPEIRIYTAN